MINLDFSIFESKSQTASIIFEKGLFFVNVHFTANIDLSIINNLDFFLLNRKFTSKAESKKLGDYEFIRG